MKLETEKNKNVRFSLLGFDIGLLRNLLKINFISLKHKIYKTIKQTIDDKKKKYDPSYLFFISAKNTNYFRNIFNILPKHKLVLLI